MCSERAGGDQGPSPTIENIVDAVLAELSEEDLRALAAQEDFDPIDHHFGLGMWIRNRFVWQNADLLTGSGIYHPDEISSKIIEEVWRRARLRHK